MNARRLVTSIALSLAAGAASLIISGAAHADEPVVDQTSNTQTSSTTQINVQTDQTATTQVGDGPTITTQSSQTIDTSATVSSDQTGDKSDSGTKGASDGDSAHKATPSTATTSTENSKMPLTATEDSLAAPAPAANSTDKADSLFVQNAYAYVQTKVASQTPLAAASAPAPSPQPLPVSGALGQLNALMAQIVIPPIFRLGWGSLPGRTAVGLGLIGLLATVLLIGTSVRLAEFVRWLKRSGFAHAARSDASLSFFNFATPTKMSFAWAVGPAASSSFYGVRNQNRGVVDLLAINALRKGVR